jgi:hypothetical protein
MNHWKRIAFCAILFLILVSPVLAQARTATITLGRDPEPPYCVQNPGGTVQIFWDIQHQTTPLRVYYKLEDPTRTIILEDQTYPGSTGITISRNWTVPNGVVDGKYWVRVEYWSLTSGNEANAEVTFYVCTDLGNLCVYKYKDANCNGIYDTGDTPVPDWWIGIVTSYGDELYGQTEADGKICWSGVPLGHYRVFEPVIDPPWQAVGPTSYEIDLVSSAVVNVQFLNVRYDDCFGACCLPNGQCVQVKPEECAALTGTWQGLGSLCTGVVCPQPGACCDPSTGDCHFVLEILCPIGFVWHAGWTCEPVNPCPVPPPTGACCDTATGNCTVTTEAACGYTWLGAGVPCNTTTCPVPPPKGACCNPATGECTYVEATQCPTGWTWMVGVLCTPNNPCPPPPPMGACCDPLGGCTLTTEAACALPSVWYGTMDCTPNECPPPVPTKNTTWGQIKSNYR